MNKLNQILNSFVERISTWLIILTGISLIPIFIYFVIQKGGGGEIFFFFVIPWFILSILLYVAFNSIELKFNWKISLSKTITYKFFIIGLLILCLPSLIWTFSYPYLFGITIMIEEPLTIFIVLPCLLFLPLYFYYRNRISLALWLENLLFILNILIIFLGILPYILGVLSFLGSPILYYMSIL